jgi:hypothetical protein
MMNKPKFKFNPSIDLLNMQLLELQILFLLHFAGPTNGLHTSQIFDGITNIRKKLQVRSSRFDVSTAYIRQALSTLKLKTLIVDEYTFYTINPKHQPHLSQLLDSHLHLSWSDNKEVYDYIKNGCGLMGKGGK